MSIWFITGCSTGLGRALAEAVLDAGHSAAVTARDAAAVQDLADAHPETALALALDVTDTTAIRAAVEAAEERFGRIDVLVNNAGYGLRGAIEETDDASIERLFATNVVGPVHVIQAALPGMRERGAGTIINISSIGARLSPPGSGFYSASKAALEGITQSLRKEVAPLGIRAVAVEPGGFRTDFSGRSLVQSAGEIDAYAATAGPRRKENDTAHGTQPGDPARAAQALIRLAESAETPSLLILGPDALTRFEANQAAMNAEIDAWRDVTNSTDLPAENTP